MKLLNTLLSLLISASLYAQKDATLLANWKHHPIPESKDTLLSYNRGPDMVVYRNHEGIKVKRDLYGAADGLPFKIASSPTFSIFDEFSGTRSVLKVSDGYLVGFDRGEFGGSLFWFSTDGKKHYKITNLNLQQFILRNGEVYAIQGLAHMGTNQGSIVKLTKKKKWLSTEYVRLPAAPRAVILDKQKNFLIICSSSLLNVDGKGKVSTLITNDSWLYYLYPNSILLDDELVYLGMRAGVLRYNLSSGEQEWLMPY